MRWRTVLYLLIVMGTSTAARAQTLADSSLTGRRIAEIRILGNAKTRSFVFHREMKQRVGDRFDPARAEEDRKRIQNLMLFNRVMVFAHPDSREVVVTVRVTEQWYLIPFPILYINDRDWGKVTYGAGLHHINFRGRAETLTALLKLGYDPSFAFGYHNPWLTGDRTWTGGFETAWHRIRNKHYRDLSVDEHHYTLRGALGRRFGYHTAVRLELGYRSVSLSPAVEGRTLSPGGTDRMPEAALQFEWDRRDLKEYPRSGWLLRGNLQKKGIPGNRIDWSRATADVRGYLPVSGGLTLAARAASTLSRGEIPVYSRVYLGYGERIRGHFYEKYGGENRILGSLALRFPLLGIRYWDMAPEAELSDLRFGVGGGFFADTGMIWNRTESLTHRKLRSGFGAGIHLFLPYHVLVRLESAWDESGRRQWIADLNVDI